MRVVYFDGYCNVCNHFVDFLIRHDHKRVLKYAPLQGTTAHVRLPAKIRDDLSTMVFEEEDGTLFTESTAAIKSIAYVGGVYANIKVFLILPRFVRDAVYRWVANHRYLFAGRRASCRLPSAQERAQFLD